MKTTEIMITIGKDAHNREQKAAFIEALTNGNRAGAKFMKSFGFVTSEENYVHEGKAFNIIFEKT